MWFLYALLTALAWGAADLFYKKGSNVKDKYSHLKIVTIVGLVMGIHGLFYMVVNDISFDPFEMVRYLPVSMLYILSMTFGYIGLRYMELSIASPVQNSSGAITAILLFIFFPREMQPLEVLGVVIITVGVISLAIIESREQQAALKLENTAVNPKYQIGILAITFPIIYAVLDALGSFADGIYLDELKLISEDNALLAYEFTFFICGVLAFIWVKFVKKQDFKIFKERDKGLAAIFETTGQFFYVFAMSGSAIIAAPLIASYAIFSAILAHIFLKERLKKNQYFVIAFVMIGIILLGIAGEL